jgi:polar amino acid transport system substrate-binding protein
MTRTALSIVLALALGLAGCQYPRDPEETLDRVSGGTMYVGVVENPPWVILHEGREPQGVEPELVRRFGEQIDAEIEWVEGSESELAEAMRGFQLDIIVGGLTRSWPYARHVALTRPYVDTEIEFGVPPGTELPDDLDEVEVWVEQSSEAAALLQQEEGEANPVYYDSLGEIDGPVLTDDFEILSIGYERTDRIQRDDEHAMAVPMGENAFLVELERFLLDRGQEAEELLQAEAERLAP